jgi:thiosulfate/3-mercaptopyruvate sulfurtransferase
MALLVLASGMVAFPTAPTDAAQPPAAETVSVGWLADHANDQNLRIIDARTSVAQYQRAHMPGAVHLANDVLRGPQGGLPVQYLDVDVMSRILARAGVSNEDRVVVYADSADVLGATMVVYCLQRIGHDRAMLLDGGLADYREAHSLTQAYPQVSEAQLNGQLDRSVFITLDELNSAMQADRVKLLDTRPASDYLGNTNRWMRNGHIPGAVNLDWHHLMHAENHHRFRSKQQMQALIDQTGVTRDDAIVVYCGTSREATLVFHVLKNMLGYPDVRLYEGSWTEYCAHTELPIEREGRIVEPATALAAKSSSSESPAEEPEPCP